MWQQIADKLADALELAMLHVDAETNPETMAGIEAVLAEYNAAVVVADAQAAAAESSAVEPTATTFTVWVMEGDRTGTTFVTSVEAPDAETAEGMALDECAEAWGQPVAELTVIGVARGDVQLVGWYDDV